MVYNFLKHTQCGWKTFENIIIIHSDSVGKQLLNFCSAFFINYCNDMHNDIHGQIVGVV